MLPPAVTTTRLPVFGPAAMLFSRRSLSSMMATSGAMPSTGWYL
jgi:hypothetical protein